MGKTKPQKVIQKCDEWLSTRNRKKASPSLNLIKKHPLSSGPWKSSSNLRLTQNSPPPPELLTNTKQSNITVFFTRTPRPPGNSKEHSEPQESDDDDVCYVDDNDFTEKDHCGDDYKIKGGHSCNQHCVSPKNTSSRSRTTLTEDLKSNDVEYVTNTESHLYDNSTSHKKVQLDSEKSQLLNRHQNMKTSMYACGDVCICDSSHDMFSQNEIIEDVKRYQLYSDRGKCNFSKDSDQLSDSKDIDNSIEDASVDQIDSDIHLSCTQVDNTISHSLKNSSLSPSCTSGLSVDSLQLSSGDSQFQSTTKLLLNSEEADEELQDFSLSMHV